MQYIVCSTLARVEVPTGCRRMCDAEYFIGGYVGVVAVHIVYSRRGRWHRPLNAGHAAGVSTGNRDIAVPNRYGRDNVCLFVSVCSHDISESS